MEIKNKQYILLLLFHIFLGIIIFYVPFLAKIYSLSIFISGVYIIYKNKNKNNEVLYVSAYLVGAEVFLRGTQGNPNYEFGKCSVILFMILGMYYSGVSKKAYLYWFFLLLLIPSILISIFIIDIDMRNKIFYNISGPVALGICSLYTFKKRITTEEINTILLAIGLPSITTCFYLLIQSPPILQSIKSTISNHLLSGNFGPNQLATSLGLAMFVFFLRLILISSNKLIDFINIIIISIIFHRALLTFSRGGVYTGIIIIIIVLCSVILKSECKSKILSKTAVFFVLFSSVFIFTSFKTNHFLLQRYNKSVSSLAKPNGRHGRPDIALAEVIMFFKNPILGVGAGEATHRRELEFKIKVRSHSEVTRMIAEHGFLGLLSLLILIIVPLHIYSENKNNVYFFSFFAFWFLTINHSAMRIAAPSFIYSLALLSLKFNKNTPNNLS